MAWFSGKVSLGNFADIAGAVNKIQESVKNIEKNFDSALGFDEKDKDKADSSNEGTSLAYHYAYMYEGLMIISIVGRVHFSHQGLFSYETSVWFHYQLKNLRGSGFFVVKKFQILY